MRPFFRFILFVPREYTVLVFQENTNNFTSHIILTCVDDPSYGNGPRTSVRSFVNDIFGIRKKDSWRIKYFPCTVHHTETNYYGNNPSSKSDQL